MRDRCALGAGEGGEDGTAPERQVAGDGVDAGDRGPVGYEGQGVWVVVVHGAFDPNSVSLPASAPPGAAVTHAAVVVDYDL